MWGLYPTRQAVTIGKRNFPCCIFARCDYSSAMMSQRLILGFLLVAFGANCFADVAPTNSIDKYKIIIERSPFKRFSPTTTGGGQDTVGSLVLNGFIVGSDIKKVCIRDTKSNLNYYKGEGEYISDYRVDKIDPDSQTVVLVRGVQIESLKFPERSAIPPQVAAAVPPRPAYRGFVRPPQPVQPPNPAVAAPNAVPNPNPAPVSPTSLRRRILRQQLRAQEPQQPQPQPAEEGEGDTGKVSEEAPAQQ